jgi:hypothetical protein
MPIPIDVKAPLRCRPRSWRSYPRRSTRKSIFRGLLTCLSNRSMAAPPARSTQPDQLASTAGMVL